MSKMKFVAGEGKPVKKLEEILTKKKGKLVFKQGSEVEKLMTRPMQKPKDLAATIYNKLLILNMLYQDLYDFSPNQELNEMIDELNIITFAMSGITTQLSGRLPVQTERKPNLADFCSGIKQTQMYLRGIQADIRRLLRVNENLNIDLQLLIINATLQEQNLELQDLMQLCNN